MFFKFSIRYFKPVKGRHNEKSLLITTDSWSFPIFTSLKDLIKLNQLGILKSMIL